MIAPGLRWAWRDQTTVQFGVDVPEPIVLTQLPPLARQLLPLLDGTRTVDAVVRDVAKATDASADDIRAVIADLVACNVLIDGGAWPGGAQLYREARSRLLPDLRAATALGHFRASPEDRLMALSHSRVTVTGLSRLGATLWTLLTAAGVGRVDADDEQLISAEDVSIGGFNPSDEGRRRSELPELRSEWVTQPRPRHLTKHLHVLTDVADFEERSRSLLRNGQPHLWLSARDMSGRVGPFVDPGRTPCRTCYTLVRRDVDPDWPDVWRQLGTDPSPQVDALVVGAVANLAARQILEWLTGGTPATQSAVLELTAFTPAPTSVALRQHPECGCSWTTHAA